MTTTMMTALVAQGGKSLNDEDAFVAESRPVPTLRPRDILVRVEAFSINPADTKSRAGIPAGNSKILGWDASGTVHAIGPEVQGFSVGEEVWYAGDVTRDGTNAEFHAVDERIVGHKPKSLSHAEAAAMPLTTITAWEILFDRFRLRNDAQGTLVVLGGAGGVGSIMTQLAKELTGVRVIATASRGPSRAWAVRMGADSTIDHHDLAGSVRAVAPDGVEWIFSSHSRGNVAAFAKALKPFGEIAAIDEPSGLDLLPLKDKSIAWHWELMFTRSKYATPDMGEQGALLEKVAVLVDAGHIQSTLTERFDGFTAESIRRAHLTVDGGAAIGKTVVARRTP